MPTICGSLDRIENHLDGSRFVQVRVILTRGSVLRIRALVRKQTIIARGTEQVDLSTLCTGELVQVSYHQGRDGFMEADTIHVRPERGQVA